ncbi:hypothetical protein SAMN02799630_00332 [Paenibacillus sp. UNCCL117]|nr:hypothetical protein SAMN04488602_102200 [Paenibacillus sp. cl123]SFW12889.1 hypothetical protein SAMN02799630_00332 [Paenibacillus sp. UNCCL117]
MFKCPACLKPTELQMRRCSHCGNVLKFSVAEKFDMLAESVEAALKKELETRKWKRN